MKCKNKLVPSNLLNPKINSELYILKDNKNNKQGKIHNAWNSTETTKH